MDKRAFLAIALSILILVIYQEWMTRYYGTPTVAPEAEKKEPERAPIAERTGASRSAADQTSHGSGQPRR